VVRLARRRGSHLVQLTTNAQRPDRMRSPSRSRSGSRHPSGSEDVPPGGRDRPVRLAANAASRSATRVAAARPASRGERPLDVPPVAVTATFEHGSYARLALASAGDGQRVARRSSRGLTLPRSGGCCAGRFGTPIERKQLPQGHDRSVADQHLGIQVLRMKLADELSTATAGRHDPTVPVHRHHPYDPALSSCHHRGRGGMFGAEPHRACGVDTHTRVDSTAFRDERRSHAARAGDRRQISGSDHRMSSSA
jgi:hypothetical protein